VVGACFQRKIDLIEKLMLGCEATKDGIFGLDYRSVSEAGLLNRALPMSLLDRMSDHKAARKHDGPALPQPPEPNPLTLPYSGPHPPYPSTSFQIPKTRGNVSIRVGETSNSFNTNNNSFNNNSFNTENNFGKGDERAEILSWLSPLEPLIPHDDIRVHRVEDAGD